MTPTEKLAGRLNKALAPHGMKVVGQLDYQRGAHRRMDLCRWFGGVGFSHGNTAMAVWSIASWSTISDCLRYGFSIDFNVPRGEADIMVEANKNT